MSRLTRRVFLVSAAALAGCRSTGRSSAAGTVPPVRAAAVGQSWRYAKTDVYTKSLVYTQVDTVSAVGATIEIESRSEGKPPGAKSSWGTAWLKKYVPRRDDVGPLPSEIQNPWGRILVDPHWSEVQVYEEPIPLWPSELRPGWSNLVKTRYKTPSDQSGLPWMQTMTAVAWEPVDVPAGRFNALRFTNLISFRSTDFSRTACERRETLWFVPEIGRWAVRQSQGTYYRDNSVDDAAVAEAGFRWELLSYT